MKKNKGFVVSAVLYPLLVLFLALIMGLISMTDTRKRILDRMKLEIGNDLFDDSSCSCDTIVNKLNYIVEHMNDGSPGPGPVNPDEAVIIDITVKKYEFESQLPQTCSKNMIAVITNTNVTKYYLSTMAPVSPTEGTVWVVQDNSASTSISSSSGTIGIGYVMQYINGKWELKKGYICNGSGWESLYYVDASSLAGENVQTVWDYAYKGEYQEFTAPFAGYYLVELWGAKGGSRSTAGGNGAYTYGTIYLNAGTKFYIYVGGTGSGATGGWNGGANGTGSYGGGGGGATDIRLLNTSSKTIWNDFSSFKTRIMVAAGGGGGTYNAGGGAGGGLTGNNGGAYSYNSSHIGTAGLGATQSMPGFLNGSPNSNLGGFGYGGNASSGDGGGGGGGYYGGGGGYSYHADTDDGGAGGGGSSYISGHEGCNSIDKLSLPTDITYTGLSYHYSGYYFKNTSMIAGNNTGAGKAKITLKSIEVKNSVEITQEKKDTLTRWNFTYAGSSAISGKSQVFTVPEDGKYKIELWGAKGGTRSTAGGNGSYTEGTIYLTKGMILYIYVGGVGYNANAGWNGGGAGSGSYGGGGGGSTDIRLIGTAQSTTWNDFSSLKSRIMVAAGGGGGTYNAGGGAGGGLTGNNGGAYSYNSSHIGTAGIGAQQSLPGYLNGSPVNTTALGGFGYAGSGAGGDGGGGGGGYYGGGGGSSYHQDTDDGGAGAGGSSYISGYNRTNSILENSSEDEILHTGSAYHYSGYYFESTTMLAGNEIMPSPTSTNNMTGNGGAGHARITLIDKTKKELATLKEEILNKETIWNYPYSGVNHSDGRYQLFTVPKNGIYSIQMWGGQGGTRHTAGGNGSYTYGKLYLNAGEKYYIYVGGSGYNAIAGWNGGGNGTGSYGGGGGGATDFRLSPGDSVELGTWKEFSSFKSRIMVAAGGGGGTYNAYGAPGGAINGNNGGAFSYNSSHIGTAGIGATQSQPGYLNGSPNSNLGGFGYAANASSGDGGGGGGGYYGGGGAYSYHADTDDGGAGGSGSSYISGLEKCNSIDEKSTATNIIFTGSVYHYSKYLFNEPKVLAGNEKMPSPYTATEITGNTGDGYARIMLLEETTKDRNTIYNDARSKETLWQYDYAGTTQLSGTYQEFTVPFDGYYKIDTWGAQGGARSSAGGNGAYASGRIYLTKLDENGNQNKLYIYVGGMGYSATAGWNGGGNSSGSYGGGGGGATDIRLKNTPLLNVWNNFSSLKTRIIVAAGGGGGSYGAGGGAGGALTGNNGGAYSYNSSHIGYAGIGATQALPGFTNTSPTGGVGDFGLGGHAPGGDGGGGGGGYYGGGGGSSYHADTDDGGGGAGGSSYISGNERCNSIEEESVADNIIHNGSMYHYSGYYFDTTSMLAGSQIMPSPTSGGTITGKTGNGYAKITLLKKVTKTLKTLKQEIVDDEYAWYYTYSGNNHTTGRYQVFNVTKTGDYTIELWGAAGGTRSTAGGLGAYTRGTISLTKGTQLYVYVGGSGYYAVAGWNGGGNSSGSYGGGGGGSTDVRTKVTSDLNLWNETTPLRSRIMVAGGGGGGTYNAYGGAAGGLTSYNGGAYSYNSSHIGTAGLAATQVAPGYLNGSPTNTTGLGGFGYAGSGVAGDGGGGGSGWYGGGGASSYHADTDDGGAGAGGSSYISGHPGCVAVKNTGAIKNSSYTTLADSVSYTGYTFVDTHMIDGQGYPWTTVKSGSTSGQPNPHGGLVQSGQSGDGFAIITYEG